jgi:hypothetical protein
MSRLCGRTMPRRRSMNRCPGNSTTLSATETAGSGRLHCHGQSGERGGDHLSVIHRTRHRHAHRGAWQSGSRSIHSLPGRRPSQPQPLGRRKPVRTNAHHLALRLVRRNIWSSRGGAFCTLPPDKPAPISYQAAGAPGNRSFSRRRPPQSVRDSPSRIRRGLDLSDHRPPGSGLQRPKWATIAASTAAGSTRQVRSPASTASSVGSPKT